MIYWIIGILIYLIIAGFAYYKFISKWDNPKFEKIWASIFWITLIPLWIVRKIQKSL